jgi:integrase
MPDTLHLWRRHNVYYLRLAIPPALRQHFPSASGKPRDKIVEPLGTGDLRQAQALRNQRVAHFERVFARLRSGVVLSPEEIAEEGRRVYDELLRPLQEVRANLPIETERQAVQWAEDKEIDRRVGEEIERIATARGIKIEPETETWRALGRTLIEAICGATGEPLPEPLATAANMRKHGTPFLQFGATVASTPVPVLPAPTAAPSRAPADGERFSEALEAHLAVVARRGRVQTTLADYRRIGEAFTKHCKDAPLSSITRAMASDFLDAVAEEHSDSTVNGCVALLSAVFEDARRRGRFEKNHHPFEDQKRKNVEADSYVPFTLDELRRLFAAAEFETEPKEYGTASAWPWAAAIAAYSGARLEEIAQMRAQDLRRDEETGIWFYDITPDAGRLKNKPSKRYVPVHSELIKIGLLKYRAALPRGVARLFPGIPPRASKGGKFGPALGDVFENRRTALGIVRPKVCFHSFRHNVSSLYDRLGVPESDTARVLGHKVEGISYGTYSKGGPGLVRVRDLVERIEYPGVALVKP